MIGGTDIVVSMRGGSAALGECLRSAQRVWPSAVFEDALTGEQMNRCDELPIAQLQEVLVYRDAHAVKEWDRLGADPSLANTMVHLLQRNNTVTMVVDDAADPTMAALLQAIRLALGSEQLSHAANGLNTSFVDPKPVAR